MCIRDSHKPKLAALHIACTEWLCMQPLSKLQNQHRTKWTDHLFSDKNTPSTNLWRQSWCYCPCRLCADNDDNDEYFLPHSIMLTFTSQDFWFLEEHLAESLPLLAPFSTGKWESQAECWTDTHWGHIRLALWWQPLCKPAITQFLTLNVTRLDNVSK